MNITNSRFDDNSASGKGGAIYHAVTSTMTIRGSTFINNSANSGGAVEGNLSGALVIENSTFTGNTATTNGGAIVYYRTALRHVTIVNNTAGNDGGGIYKNSVSGHTVYNSIIYNNTANGTGSDIKNNCTGSLVTGSVGNIIGNGDCGATMTGNPLLGALAPTIINGVTQSYYPLGADSPALEMADATQCNNLPQDDMMRRHDQIGTVRPQPASTTCDIGAIESSNRKPTPTLSPTASDTPTVTPTATATTPPHNVTLNGTACNIYDAITAANTNTATGACLAGRDGNVGTNAPDLIVLQQDVTMSKNFPKIVDHLEIESSTGNTYTIDGGDTYYAFATGARHIESDDTFLHADLSLERLKLTKMVLGPRVASTLLAGAISLDSRGELKLTRVEISDTDGAIAIGNGTLTVDRSLFRNNERSAAYGGGAICRGHRYCRSLPDQH